MEPEQSNSLHLLGLLLALGGLTACRIPDVTEKAARKLLVMGRNAMGHISQRATRVRTPNSGSLAPLHTTIV